MFGDVGRLNLLKERRVQETMDKNLLDHGCLHCSEDEPHHCHRRLVAEYLKHEWGDMRLPTSSSAASKWFHAKFVALRALSDREIL